MALISGHFSWQSAQASLMTQKLLRIFFPQKNHNYHVLNQSFHGRKLNLLILLWEGLSQETHCLSVICLNHIYKCSHEHFTPTLKTFPSVSFAPEIKTEFPQLDTTEYLVWMPLCCGLDLAYQSRCLIYTPHLYSTLHSVKYVLNVLREGNFSRGNNCISRNTHLSGLKSGSYILNAAWFVRAEDCKEPYCPSVEDLLNTIWRVLCSCKKGMQTISIHYYGGIATIKWKVKNASWR